MGAIVSQDKIAIDVAKPESATKQAKKNENGIGYWVATITLTAVAWLIGNNEYYNAGSPLGYNLGLIGGILMLLLLLYPLRKRIRFMHSWIPIKYWFMAHMFLGVAGPMLIMFHCNLRFGSLNGAVAFYSMTAVFVSGLVGRFIYTRIHHGLYGRHSTLGELKTRLGMSTEDMHSKFHFPPDIERRLQRFESMALNASTGAGTLWRSLTMGLMSRWTYFRASRSLKREIKRHAREKGWDASKRRQRLVYGKQIIQMYLRTVLSVVQFNVYERLFSLWHILHVPLMFLLVISGVVHVLAVHMY